MSAVAKNVLCGWKARALSEFCSPNAVTSCQEFGSQTCTLLAEAVANSPSFPLRASRSTGVSCERGRSRPFSRCHNLTEPAFVPSAAAKSPPEPQVTLEIGLEAGNRHSIFGCASSTGKHRPFQCRYISVCRRDSLTMRLPDPHAAKNRSCDRPGAALQRRSGCYYE